MLSALRYGGLSVGGQLPILEVDPEDIQSVFRQLGRILNITGVLPLVLIMRIEYIAHEVSLLDRVRVNVLMCSHRATTLDLHWGRLALSYDTWRVNSMLRYMKEGYITGLLLGPCFYIVKVLCLLVSPIRCGTTTKAGTPWWPSWM